MFPEDRFVELLIIGALALIFIGPKDLPIVMRRIGRFVGKMRGMAAEFRASFDELARQSELDELRKEVEALRTAQPAAMAAQAVGLGDVHADVSQTFEDINTGLLTGDAQLHPPMGGYQHPEEPEAVMTPLPQVQLVEPPPPPPEGPKPPRKRAPRKPKPQPDSETPS
jgi:sec-independent protein translocase protein TatB